MRKILCVILCLTLMVIAAGCSVSGSGNDSSSGIKQEEVTDGADTATDSAADDVADTSVENDTEEAQNAQASGIGDVDIDLTTLSSTMVYAQVYDMMTNPDDFLGKKVKAKGPFAVYTDEGTGKNYFACIIQDAAACCSQGMEFELAGKHDYPDDYPKKNTEITVVGTFDKYEDQGATYCTLRKAELVK